mgnify:CR=1 FL=1|tara:strand:- start:386 stop:568 length:183 start_codon:yes stop_codon:yes gene_type:complete
MTEPAKFVYVTRVIGPKSGIHYLDAIDDQGRHWTAEMTHGEEKWITYTKTWKLDPQKLYD